MPTEEYKGYELNTPQFSSSTKGWRELKNFKKLIDKDEDLQKQTSQEIIDRQTADNVIKAQITAHTTNNEIHTTKIEKDYWNGKLDDVIAGENIIIDKTNPKKPVISCKCSGKGEEDAEVILYTTGEEDNNGIGGYSLSLTRGSVENFSNPFVEETPSLFRNRTYSTELYYKDFTIKAGEINCSFEFRYEMQEAKEHTVEAFLMLFDSNGNPVDSGIDTMPNFPLSTAFKPLAHFTRIIHTAPLHGFAFMPGKSNLAKDFVVPANHRLVLFMLVNQEKIQEETPDLEIKTAQDLKNFRDRVNNGETFEGKTIGIMNDIDLQGSETNQWIPIGTGYSGSANKFLGTLDGCRHTIKGIYISGADKDFQGLFHTLTGTVKNLRISDSYIAGRTYVGAFAGEKYGYRIVSHIENCCVDSSVTVISSGNPVDVVGLDENIYIGGFVGYVARGGDVINCYSAAKVEIVNPDHDRNYIGGFTSSAHSSSNVENCFYDKQTSGQSDSNMETIGLTTAQMGNEENFVGWDFEKIWEMGSIYPKFRANTRNNLTLSHLTGYSVENNWIKFIQKGSSGNDKFIPIVPDAVNGNLPKFANDGKNLEDSGISAEELANIISVPAGGLRVEQYEVLITGGFSQNEERTFTIDVPGLEANTPTSFQVNSIMNEYETGHSDIISVNIAAGKIRVRIRHLTGWVNPMPAGAAVLVNVFR